MTGPRWQTRVVCTWVRLFALLSHYDVAGPWRRVVVLPQCGEAIAGRRKEERRAGIASRGMVRRLGRFASRVRHRVVPDRDRVPERCNSSGSAVDVCSDAPAEAQRAECAADGGVVYVSRALSVSPSALRIHAQHVARFAPYNTRNCLPPKKLHREIQ